MSAMQQPAPNHQSETFGSGSRAMSARPASTSDINVLAAPG